MSVEWDSIQQANMYASIPEDTLRAWNYTEQVVPKLITVSHAHLAILATLNGQTIRHLKRLRSYNLRADPMKLTFTLRIVSRLIRTDAFPLRRLIEYSPMGRAPGDALEGLPSLSKNGSGQLRTSSVPMYPKIETESHCVFGHVHYSVH